MDETTKYLIRARVSADGVVERSDVVGAVFGQTEGLLGDELDLRDLQQASKVGRIDVEVDSENGQSFGRLTIASSLDRVETAIVAASLETITRIGPCQARVEVTNIEDVREAKRRAVVERAKELLAESFDEPLTTTEELLEEVRKAVRVEDITEYRGLPAGPRVADSDAIVLVEGRSDVLTLLRYGVKNALGVEGTNVPETVADLTHDRTVTAFLDGDRGGELILRELLQVGEVDYVAFAPEGRSVEDLSRAEVLAALRDKVPFDVLPEEGSLRAAVAGDDGPGPRGLGAGDGDPVVSGGGTGPDATRRPPPDVEPEADADPGPGRNAGAADGTTHGDGGVGAEAGAGAGTHHDDAGEGAGREPTATDAAQSARSGSAAVDTADGDGSGRTGSGTTASTATEVDADAAAGSASATGAAADARNDASEGETEADPDGTSEAEPDAEASDDGTAAADPETLRGHVREVIGGGTGRVRLLDGSMTTLDERPATEAFAAVRDVEPVAYAVVLDGELSQRVLDVAAQRGVEQVVAADTGEFVKQPVDVRVRTADQLASA
jgi:hypothetical protein